MSLLTAARPAQSRAATLRHSWVSTTEDIQAIRWQWTHLFEEANCQSAFLSPEWMLTWWKHFGAREKLAVLTLRNNEGLLVGLAPFYIARHKPLPLRLRRLGFLADDFVGSDYLTILAAPGYEADVVERTAEEILASRAQWDYIEFRDMIDSPMMRALSQAIQDGNQHPSHRFGAATCYFTALPDSMDDYLAGVASRARRDYRKFTKILKTEHEGSLEVYNRVEDIKRLFPELLRLHDLRFQERNEQSAVLKPGVPEFQQDAAITLAQRGFARLLVMKTKDKPVAALYGFSVGGGFQYYQTGMDPEYMNLSPGKLVIGKAIEHAIETGHKEFDFLQGSEKYKADWAKTTRQTYTERFYDHRVRSQMAHTYLQVRWRASKAKAALQNWNSREENVERKADEVKIEATKNEAVKAQAVKNEKNKNQDTGGEKG